MNGQANIVNTKHVQMNAITMVTALLKVFVLAKSVMKVIYVKRKSVLKMRMEYIAVVMDNVISQLISVNAIKDGSVVIVINLHV